VPTQTSLLKLSSPWWRSTHCRVKARPNPVDNSPPVSSLALLNFLKISPWRFSGIPMPESTILILLCHPPLPRRLICNRTVKNQQTTYYGKFIHPYEEVSGTAVKCNFLSLDVDSLSGLSKNYLITLEQNSLEPEKAKRCISNCKLFKLSEIYDSCLDIPKPLITAFRKRVWGVPLHFDHTNRLIKNFKLLFNIITVHLKQAE
jgi:hypothetical protein